MSYWKKIIRFYFRCFHLYKASINTALDTTEKITLPKGYTFRLLKDEDYSTFIGIEEIGTAKLKILEARIKDPVNWQCLGIFETRTGSLAYYNWINKKSSYFTKELNRTVSFKKSEALFEDDFTLPGHRGLGLHTYGMAERLKYCAQNNIAIAYIIIECGNIPALKTIEKFGFTKDTFNPYTYRNDSMQESICILQKKIISNL